MQRKIIAAAAAAALGAPALVVAGGTEQWVPIASEFQSAVRPDGITRFRYGAGNVWAEITISRPIVDCRRNGSWIGVTIPAIPANWNPSCEAWMTPAEDAPLTPSTSPNAPPTPPTDRAPVIDMVGAQPGFPGFDVERVKATTESPAAGDGAFRVACDFGKWGYFDPIVYPGIADRSHLHMFFANVGVTKDSTHDSLVKTGNSTCRGGTVDRSSYWAPAMVDTATGKPVRPSGGMFYYKTGYGTFDRDSIAVWPDGLRMIAGYSMASAPGAGLDHLFRCSTRISSQSIPKCNAGEYLRMEINFPECWDGKNLDSPNHQDHMAYRMAQKDKACPASHPVDIPRITYHIDFPVTAADDTTKWRLASDMYDSSLPGGYSAHADFFDGWKPEVKAQIVAQCIRAKADCHAHLIGNKQAIY